jgi:large subunit ribosomal protein L31
MKKKTHPKWYPKAKITCACGHTFTAGSTKPQVQVDICSHCHPFFTGQMKYIDVQGRVEKFQAKQKAAKTKKYIKKKDRKKLQQKREEEKEKKRPKNLKEMLKKG